MSEEKSTDLVAGIERSKIKELDQVAKTYSLNLLSEDDPFSQALTMAEGIQRLQELLTPDVMEKIMLLQGKALGFKTDKDYPVAAVRDCFIEARLRGLNPINNEWNIIAGNVYTTQNGYERLVRDWPGLTDLDLRCTLPKLDVKGAEIKFSATWKLDGTSDSLEGIIPVKVNAGSGADAALGKGRRKSLKAIYDKLNGSATSLLPPEGDVDDVHIINEAGGTSTSQQNTDPLAAGKHSMSNKDKIPDAEVVPPKVDQDTVGKIIDSFGGLGVEPELLEQYICCPLSELTEKDVEKFRELLRDINSGKVNCEDTFSRQKVSS